MYSIYISRLCYDVSVRLSVRLSVTEVHWRITANLGFKFRSQLPRIAVAVHVGASTELFIVQWARGKGLSPGRVEGSSRAMLATARPSCNFCKKPSKLIGYHSNVSSATAKLMSVL